MSRGPGCFLLLLLALGAFAGCGSADPGPPTGANVPRSEAPRALDPAPGTLACLVSAHLAARRVSPQVIQIGPAASRTRIFVAGTIGAAELDQLRGRAEGAEVADRLEFFPGHAPEGEVTAIEGCVNAHSTDGT